MNLREKELTYDILVLVGRLYGENPDTFSPETAEVMRRWRTRYKQMLDDAAQHPHSTDGEKGAYCPECRSFVAQND